MRRSSSTPRYSASPKIGPDPFDPPAISRTPTCTRAGCAIEGRSTGSAGSPRRSACAVRPPPWGRPEAGRGERTAPWLSRRDRLQERLDRRPLSKVNIGMLAGRRTGGGLRGGGGSLVVRDRPPFDSRD